MDFSCSICNKGYKSYQSVWNHKKRFHTESNDYIDNKKRAFSCPNCNKKFTRKDSMSYHIKTPCAIKKTNDDKITKLEKQVAILEQTIKKTNNKTICKTNTCNYVYLIEKFDMNNNMSIYKFGKTNRPILDRIKEHCLTSKVLFILEVSDCDISENNILKILNNDIKITRNKYIGNEYFCCDDKEYIVNTVLKNLIK
jgi:hypothetical protein